MISPAPPAPKQLQAAYALGLLGFGRLIDGLGTKRGHSISVLLWSVAAAGHALARSPVEFSSE